MSSGPAEQPSNTRGLFADICGALAYFGAALGPLFVLEAVDRAIVPLDWWVYFMLWIVLWIAIIGIAAKWFRGAYDRYLGRIDARLPTPIVLQRGYGWILEKWRNGPLLAVVIIGVAMGFILPIVRAVLKNGVLDPSSESATPFLSIVLILCASFAFSVAIFLLASLVAGLALGKPRANSDSS